MSSKLHSFWFTCITAVLMFLSFTKFAEAENISTLKERYLKLRNTDAHIQKEKEWRSLASQFVAYAKTHPKSGEGATALYNASMLYIELGRVKGDDTDLERAVNLLAEIIDDFPQSSLQDDSLKVIADIRFQQGDVEQAEEDLKILLKRFPNSEFADYAKAKLSGAVPVQRNFAQTGQEAITVVLDPGHGGEDYGAVGVSDLLEKDVTLSVAIATAEKLKKEGIRVVLTRKQDEFVPLQRRTEIANDENAALFVSLHANASPKGALSGLETYYVDNTGDQASKKLAERENAAGGGTGLPDDLQMMLSDLIQQAKTPESIQFAKIVSQSVANSVKGFPVGPNHGVKKAPFYVLVGAHMPAVLVELYFINNASEGNLLLEKEFREALSVGLTKAILRYLNL